MATSQPAPPFTLIKFDQPIPTDGNTPAPARTALPTRGEPAVEEVLDSILPPRKWTQSDGSAWLQHVSKEPTSREEVLTLQQALEQQLVHRQARQHGICPVREELFGQAFDELIRQVCVEAPERGLLLMRVRDEARMTVDAYRTLYASSVTFGVRKQLQAQEGVPEMAAELQRLSELRDELDGQVHRLRHRIEVGKRRGQERRELDEKGRKEEVEFLRHQQKHLEHFLRNLPAGGGN